jgi:hypothetical protein
MFLSGFDKVVLVFVIVVGLVLAVSAANIDTSKPFHPLQQISVGVGANSNLSVDNDGDGNIDFANNANKVLCPNGAYDSVENCGLGGGGTGSVGFEKVYFDMNRLSCDTGDFSDDSGCVDGGDTTNWVLSHILNMVGSIDQYCKYREFASSTTFAPADLTYSNINRFRSCITGPENNELCSRACSNPGVRGFYGFSKVYSGGYAIGGDPFSEFGKINCVCIDYNVDGGGTGVGGGTGGVTLPTCNDGEYLKKNATGWECVDREQLLSIKVPLNLTNLSCGDYDHQQYPFTSFNTQNTSTCSIGGGDSKNWVLAAIINHYEVGSFGSNCVYGGSGVYSDNTKFQNCIRDSLARDYICSKVCKTNKIIAGGSTSWYSESESYDGGYSTGGSPTTNYGEINCVCFDYD